MNEADAYAHQLVGIILALPRRAGPARRRVLALARLTARAARLASEGKPTMHLWKPLAPRFCGGDHCSQLWNLPCDDPVHRRSLRPQECEHPYRAVFFNPYNAVVQCHRCGEVIAQVTVTGPPDEGQGQPYVAPHAFKSDHPEHGVCRSCGRDKGDRCHVQ